MYRDRLIEPIGFVVAATTFLYSLYLFYHDTGNFFGSLAAGLIAAGLGWMTFVILRLILLTVRK